MISVLNHGYVKVENVLGNDLTPINAARASFNKRSDFVDGELKPADKKLLKFLIDNKHWSPFRHCAITFECRAPLMVIEQWRKHQVASAISEQNGHNQNSGRYITDNWEFYIPKANEWRTAPENKKQGSSKPLEPYAPTRSMFFKDYGEWWSKAMQDHIQDSLFLYDGAIKKGIAPEVARIFLPAYALYANFYWTASLESVVNFINLRTAPDAQHEIRQYGDAVLELTRPLYPATLEAWGL